MMTLTLRCHRLICLVTEEEARRPHREEEVVEEAVEEVEGVEGEARRPHREEEAVEEVSCNSLLTNVDSVVSCESLVVRLCC